MDAIAKMPTYEAYKDSGVEWLGSVPKGWELSRLGGYFTERRSKVSDVDYPPLSVTKNGVVPQLDNAAKTKDGDNRKLVKAGDFVINSRSDRKGSSGVSNLDGSVSLINIVLEPKSIHPKYCHHLLKSYIFIEEYYRVGRGIVADLWTTRYDEMRTITLAIPSMEEQTLIANFLDQKTAQIDEAIAIKEQQIALLKERKQIIIQKAVTRGLDPDVPMKDSGVDWIGEIPEHWNMFRLKQGCKKITDGAHISPDLTSELHPFISTVNVDDYGNIDFERCIYTSQSCFDYLKNTGCSPLKGDVLFSKDGTVGRTAVVDGSRDFVIASSLVIIRPDRKFFCSSYLELVLASGLIKKQTDSVLSGSALKRISIIKVSNLLLFKVPKEEQLGIVRFCEGIASVTKDAVELHENQISKLKEYKTTLINSAVTGKIRITPEMVA